MSDPEKALELWREMLRIRLIEESIADKYSEQEMRCPVHLSIGQEAPAVGVCYALNNSDWVFSGHRSHAHYLAKGGDLKKMLAEIYGKATGCCGGKGGSMHLTDQEAGFIGATPIVGSTVPIAAGAALTSQIRKEKRVVVIFLGDGAMETGVVHETLNFAVLKQIPLLFVCENNLYSVCSPLSVRQPANRTLSHLAAGHGMRTLHANGNDAEAIALITEEACEEIRKGSGPVFLELPTYRWREHCGPNFDNDIGYRTKEEYLEWIKKDPVELLAPRIHVNKIKIIEEQILEEIEDAFNFAKSSPFPDVNTASQKVYA
jgi:TPP-dependent pyruvate/acetoin dehydrogenase alpha subunit